MGDFSGCEAVTYRVLLGYMLGLQLLPIHINYLDGEGESNITYPGLQVMES